MPPRIVVLGGSGFVGRHVVARLVALGYQRGRADAAARSREAPHPAADGRRRRSGHPRSGDARAAVRRRASRSINLVGIINEIGPQHLRARARRADAQGHRRVHGAAGAATAAHERARRGARRPVASTCKTKAAAEAMVAASGLRWTIFRPSVIFGREDRFLNLFARLHALAAGRARSPAPNAQFQPVFVGDVAHCFVQSRHRRPHRSRPRYDLCGPKVYTLQELVAYVGEVSGARAADLPARIRGSRSCRRRCSSACPASS